MKGLTELYAGCSDQEPAVIVDFLERATAIQVEATAKLTEGKGS